MASLLGAKAQALCNSASTPSTAVAGKISTHKPTTVARVRPMPMSTDVIMVGHVTPFVQVVGASV